HVAIIMDGNGRWAKKRNLPRIMGHRSGVKTVDVISAECSRLGISALTLYTFSSENWKRPQTEIKALMELLAQGVKKSSGKMKKNNIRFNVIGDVSAFSESLQNAVRNLMKETFLNSGMVLTLALNYGSRQEILNAAKALSDKIIKTGMDMSSLTEGDFSRFLYTCDLPDPDLVIRTSGEKRLSNFLLWQVAYSEFYFTDVLWPDFDVSELRKALEDYSDRERRFGE
ncbi:MAG: isoprenyl transferase, partial [Candidatus Omnitrophica bacterium]|nr:isoprenyl transferase [Candidatus Omnitrophota bacterium]